ncbi:hypothetical protein BGW36DRAFT_435214 [Talaromyces proteolyticus]|uniref:Rho-GAP domain-containing protein n=1 Tax=Talaromyces proteolyticus TaxID=1131652 RepID=A0AAD4L0P8_9EURO|nr:uncharacterized protein BGW36DRAFT_435214 [Talaromyces proteolyticus]KAH8705392.1 hypothetical protein BGW36DRAFT_435214 [Talaromyces proteolyticus]
MAVRLLVERICTFFRPLSPVDVGFTELTSSTTSIFDYSEKTSSSPAVEQLLQRQQQAKISLYQNFLIGPSQAKPESKSDSPLQKATTSNKLGKQFTPTSLPHGMSSAGAATTTNAIEPSKLVTLSFDERETPPSGQSSVVKISTSFSWRGRLQHKSSRGFALVKNAFRHRRSLPMQPPTELPTNSVMSQLKFGPDGDDDGNSIVSMKVVPPSTTASSTTIVGPSTSSGEPSEPRKVSDQTVKSDTSYGSGDTVHHRPSRKASSPIAPADQDPLGVCIQPAPPVARSSASIKAAQLAAGIPPSPTSPNSDFIPGFPEIGPVSTYISENSDYNPPTVPTLRRYMLHQRLFSDTGIELRHQRALRDFNDLAGRLGLYRLVVPERDPINFKSETPITPPKPSKKKSFLHKVRSMRSSFRLRGATKDTPALRRVKTFTGLSARFYSMDSLKGKSLEILSRLGGHSTLTFPGDFSPAVMRLPSCLVSMIDYLKIHAPKARNVFFEPGDSSTAFRIYNHFADQVLSAEREKYTIHSTIRKSGFPAEVVGFGNEEETFLSRRFHVLPVAWVFKYVLAGIPGGILGSPRLYLTLVDITYKPFPDEANLHVTGIYGLYGGTPATSWTRNRAISLAILALTDDLQLDLICAVFGLCTLLDYETSRQIEFNQMHDPVIGCTGMLTRERIVQAFAPLLSELTATVGEDDVQSEAFYVMRMMMANWRGVSRQLHDLDV